MDEFTALLDQLPTLRAPGVSGTRIKKLTELAVANVSQSTAVVQTLYAHAMATPASHKLGIVYVIDLVLRAWHAQVRDQPRPGADTPEGTAGAGVYQIQQILPAVLKDALAYMVDEDERSKVSKLLEIWTKGSTFEQEVIDEWRVEFFPTTTPKGKPPPSVLALVPPPPPAAGLAPPPPPPADGSNPLSILAALASLAGNGDKEATPEQTTAAAPALTAAPAADPSAILGLLQLMSQSTKPEAPAKTDSYVPPANGLYVPANSGPSYVPPTNGLYVPPTAGPSYVPPTAGPSYGSGSGAPPSQESQFRGGAPPSQESQFRSDPRSARDRDPPRAAPSGYTRERSPPRVRDPRRLPPQGHVLGERNSEDNPHYRPHTVLMEALPPGCIKVLLRTLFMGGIPGHMSDKDLAATLKPYADVQLVILNSERKHAFIKVYSRAEALRVVNDFNNESELRLRIRWGVGYGPRDCCDYQQGISVIPTARLTEADLKWAISAEWGGTGGTPLQPGMVIEEPDIEIGTGVSSKAISKKMPTNLARNGPRSQMTEGGEWGGARGPLWGGRAAAPPQQQGQPPQAMAGAPPDFTQMMQAMAAMNGGQVPDMAQMAQFFQQQQGGQGR